MLPFLPLLLVSLLSKVVTFEVSVHPSGEDITEVDFTASTSFNVEGFTNCGCPRFRPGLPSSRRYPLVNPETSEIDLNAVVRCLQAFPPEDCQDDALPELSVNLIEGDLQEVTGVCTSEDDSCDNDNNPETTPSDGTMTINFFVSALCDQTCFKNVGVATHNGDPDTQTVLGDLVTTYSTFDTIKVDISIIGDDLGDLLDTSTGGGGNTVSFTGSVSAVNNWIATQVAFVPTEADATNERRSRLSVSVSVPSREDREGYRPCTKQFDLVVAAFSPPGNDLVFTTASTISESQTAGSLTCLNGVVLTIEQGVEVIVTGDVRIDCVIAGGGTLVVTTGPLICGELSPGTLRSTSIVGSFEVTGTCTIFGPITCAQSTPCGLNINGGTVNVLATNALPVDMKIRVDNGGTIQFDADHTFTGDFYCRDGQFQVNGQSTVVTFSPTSNSRWGTVSTATDTICAVRMNPSRATLTPGIVNRGRLRARQITGSGAHVTSERTELSVPTTMRATTASVWVGPVELVVADLDDSAKHRIQGLNPSNVVFIEWNLVTNVGDNITLLPGSQIHQLGACTLDGQLTIPSGAIFDVQTPSDGTITSNGTPTSLCNIGGISQGDGDIIASGNGVLGIQTGANIGTDITGNPSAVLNIGGTGGNLSTVNLNGAMIHGNGVTNIGPGDISGDVNTGANSQLNFVFGPTQAEIGQILGNLLGPANGTTRTGTLGEGRFTPTPGTTVDLVTGNVTGNVDDLGLNLPGSEPVNITFTPGNQTSGTVTFTAVNNPSPSVPPATPTAPTAVINNNNNNNNNGAQNTPPPAAPVNTGGGGGDGGGNAGVIGGVAGGIGGGLLLLCVCAAVGAIVHNTSSGTGGSKYNHRDYGHADQERGYGEGSGFHAPAPTPASSSIDVRSAAGWQ